MPDIIKHNHDKDGIDRRGDKRETEADLEGSDGARVRRERPKARKPQGGAPKDEPAKKEAAKKKPHNM